MFFKEISHTFLMQKWLTDGSDAIKKFFYIICMYIHPGVFTLLRLGKAYLESQFHILVELPQSLERLAVQGRNQHGSQELGYCTEIL